VNLLIRSALLQKGDFNTFSVDWSVGASTSSYITARSRVEDVGRVVAQFVDFLSRVGSMNFSTLSLIGHSLGAHIAGIAGKRVTRGRVQSIIGLDAAGPLFLMGESENRLDSTDALYVEHIVTNGGTLG
jgi:pancreatic triacylglycerol lipase